MAKYNIYGHVLYSEIEYEKLMNTTERIFINALMARLGSIEQWTNEIWNDIDHEYMIKTLDEIKQDVIKGDIELLLKYSNTTIDIEQMIQATDKIKNLYDINSLTKFKEYEKQFGKRVAKKYKQKLNNYDPNLTETEFLTQVIKDYSEVNNCVGYKDKRGLIVRHVNISTYLSMLYNVNITRTGWNQTFKDAEYFEKDLLLLETHPNSCPICAPMQRKSIFKNRQIKISKYRGSL